MFNNEVDDTNDVGQIQCSQAGRASATISCHGHNTATARPEMGFADISAPYFQLRKISLLEPFNQYQIALL
jgi:hypothetical protein